MNLASRGDPHRVHSVLALLFYGYVDRKKQSVDQKTLRRETMSIVAVTSPGIVLRMKRSFECEIVGSRESSGVSLEIPEKFSIAEVIGSPFGKRIIHPKSIWCVNYEWSQSIWEPGVYDSRLPMLHSSNHTIDHQQGLLLSDEQMISVAIGMIGMMSLQHLGIKDPVDGGWLRTGNSTSIGCCVTLNWSGEKLRLSSTWGGYCIPYEWAGSMKKIN